MIDDLTLLQSMRINPELEKFQVVGSHYEDATGKRGWHVRFFANTDDNVEDVWVVDGKHPSEFDGEAREAVMASIKTWEAEPNWVKGWY